MQDQYPANAVQGSKGFIVDTSKVAAGSRGISAKLFCKRSQVTFMSYKVVLKDERRTSNIERPTSNEKQTSNTEHSTIWQLFNDLYDSHRILEQPFF